jgi:hypothetical protein
MSFLRLSGPVTTTYRDPVPGERWDRLAGLAYAGHPDVTL